MWTFAGDGVSGVGACFHPGKEEDQRDPAAPIMFDFGADAMEGAGKLERQVHCIGLKVRRIEAVLRRRGDEIFAADERANGVNGAGLVHEKRTGDALVKVIERQLASGFGAGEPVFFDDAVDETGGGELEESLVEALGEFLLLGFGEGSNPGGEGLGLEDAEGDQLAATGAAASLAGDGTASLG